MFRAGSRNAYRSEGVRSGLPAMTRYADLVFCVTRNQFNGRSVAQWYSDSPMRGSPQIDQRQRAVVFVFLNHFNHISNASISV